MARISWEHWRVPSSQRPKSEPLNWPAVQWTELLSYISYIPGAGPVPVSVYFK